MNEDISRTRSRKTIFGFSPADLLGIIIMLVPFYIATFMEFKYEKGLFLWVTTTVPTHLHPGMVSSLCAVVFYVALLTRCQMLAVDTFAGACVTAVRTFLNCWVIASLMTMIVPSEEVKGLTVSTFLQNKQSTFLLCGLLLSWLGMRTLSGYSWILFIIAAWKNLLIHDKAMGMWGAVYIITLAISLLLQILNYVKLTDLIQDFRGVVDKRASSVRTNINHAADDAKNRAKETYDFVREKVSEKGGVKPSFHISRNGATRISDDDEKRSKNTNYVPGGNASDLLKALDVNGDGVIDEKDIEMLRNSRKE